MRTVIKKGKAADYTHYSMGDLRSPTSFVDGHAKVIQFYPKLRESEDYYALDPSKNP